MLTLLTATGCRPAAFDICQHLMARQTFTGPVKWIIVDDGAEPQPLRARGDWLIEIVRPRPFWQLGQNTQARNLLAGLEHVRADDKLVVIEDDDCYAPTYLETVDAWLDGQAELVGEKRARYYHFGTRKYRQLSNEQHASLCSTAMKGSAIDKFRRACMSRPKFIDLDLWRASRITGRLFDTQLVVGIKGLPGRMGIGMGHKAEFAGHVDATGAVLRAWTGVNADLYGVAA